MNRKRSRVGLWIVMAVLALMAMPFQSFAADAKISFSDPSLEVGSEVDVTMKFTCTSGETLGNIVVMLAYDANMLEFTNGSEYASGGAGAIRVASGVVGSEELTTTLGFRALQAGSTQITITSWEGYDADGQLLNVTHQGSSSITISGGETNYSSDASLKSLEIAPGTLNPAFSPEIENYTATVGLDTERLVVSAVRSSDKATVELEGTELSADENTVVCRVTAEDGSTVRNYTILVSKVEGGETTGGENSGTNPGNVEVLAHIEAAKTPLKIGIMALPEGASVPAGMKESAITIGDARVQGWIPETEGEQPEYCIFYGVSQSGVEGFYCYDRTDKTLQRFFNYNTDEQQEELLAIAQQYNDLVDDYNLMKWIVVGAAALAVILFILLIITLVSSSRRKQGGRGRYQEMAESGMERPADRKLTHEERYMMGEEDEYDYLPEVAATAQDSVEDIERKLASDLAGAASEASGESKEVEDSANEDDFEFFDLDE